MVKTIFDTTSREEIINRINALHDDSPKQRGKMNVYQMVTHCSTWDAWIQGVDKPVYKRSLIGRIFGRMVLKRFTKDDKILDRNTPTSDSFIIREVSGDFAAKKNEWMKIIADYEHFSNETFIHDFFGKMTKEELGILAYKHSDHHLRQFSS